MPKRTDSRPRPTSRRPHLDALEDRRLLDAAALAAGPARVLVGRWDGLGGKVDAFEVLGGVAIDEALESARTAPGVLYAESDQVVSIDAVPNDARFGELWGMRNAGQSAGTVDADVDADDAWDLARGGARTVVGVIDTGIDYTHPDLYKNIWLNPRELPAGLGLVDTDGDGGITFWDLNEPANAGKLSDVNANGRVDGGDALRDARWADGRDNDGNGRVDDLIGWDFANNDNDPFDDNAHGTHVAGTIGAMGDNAIGVAGVAWKSSMMALKFLSAGGSGSVSAAAAALDYAVAMGAKLSNNSWGGGGYSTTMFAALTRARDAGHVFVAAAGNNGTNNDASPNYPASYALDNVVAVAATDRNDRLASFSNTGAVSVDLAAPGAAILSTVPNGGYAVYSGTSMATPHVTGVFALLAAARPGWTASQAITQVLATADRLPTLAGKVATGARLNAFRALGGLPADTTGARVLTAVPNGTSAPGRLRLTFSEPINPATFTAVDVTRFSGPSGSVAVTGVVPVANSNNTQFDVTFSPLPAGTYTYSVGPEILDVAGNRMDQNANGVSGEAADAYNGSLAVNARSTFTNATAVAIPDRPRGASSSLLTSTIRVTSDLTIADLDVRIDADHTWDSDLTFQLTHAETGLSVWLVRNRGGSGDHFRNTVLDDEAALSISQGSAPFNGSYRPEQALSAFDGRNARGTWTLRVQDWQTADVGTLRSWSITVSAAATSTATARVGARSLGWEPWSWSASVPDPWQQPGGLF